MNLAEGTPEERIKKLLGDGLYRTVPEITFFTNLPMEDVVETLRCIRHLWRFTEEKGVEYAKTEKT